MALISAEEYLNSTYRPDREFVGGALMERGDPTLPHSVLQMILIQYFATLRRTLNFLALPEVRTQIVERARYRIPDILLCPKPLPKGKVVNITPPVVIEIPVS